MCLFSAMLFVLIVFGVGALSDSRTAHINAERRAGEPLVEGPTTAHGQVFYAADGVRQVYCPFDAGSLTDCRWLADRPRPCAAAAEAP